MNFQTHLMHLNWGNTRIHQHVLAYNPQSFLLWFVDKQVNGNFKKEAAVHLKRGEFAYWRGLANSHVLQTAPIIRHSRLKDKDYFVCVIGVRPNGTLAAPSSPRRGVAVR